MDSTLKMTGVTFRGGLLDTSLPSINKVKLSTRTFKVQELVYRDL